jgi:hypothetical protein
LIKIILRQSSAKPAIMTARRIFIFVLIILCTAFTPYKAGVMQKKDVVFCLDLSASTNGLIYDISNNLWHFINYNLHSSPESELKIGIVGYGRPSFGARSDYVKVISDFTDNYDYLSEELFNLKINVEKGDQMVGSALYTACKRMSWGKNSKKVIFLFGNGSVANGSVNYLEACGIANDKNITVYPVYCVQRNVVAHELMGYKTIADKTGGHYNTMLLSHSALSNRLSNDALWLKDLNDSLNNTYLYYSKDGAERYKMMLDADKNSIEMNEEHFYSRCAYKISDHYQFKCAEWDLISLMKVNPPDLRQLNAAYLPKDFQALSPQQLYEIAMHTKEKRNKLVSDMRTAFVRLKNTKSEIVNPMDSIVLAPMR